MMLTMMLPMMLPMMLTMMLTMMLQEWATSNKVPMLHREVKPHAAINTTTLYKTEEEVSVAPTNILQVSMSCTC